MRDDNVSLCAGCGEPLDTDRLACRLCGEMNTADEEPGARVDRIDPALLDRLGEWSHVKHDILQKYAHAYTTVLSKQAFVKRVVYIDGFAGTGVAQDRETGERHLGSAMAAVKTLPPFTELHFVEENSAKAAALSSLTEGDARVHVYLGDANDLLQSTILRRCRYEDYARALCLLDPYGLSVDWGVLKRIGAMKSVEIFFNFMVVGANRNVLWRRPELVPPDRLALMDRVWGDRSWQDALYSQREDLFGPTTPDKLPNAAVAEAYRKRLREVAGFDCVPEPIPMKNTRGATMYYLFFASPNAVGAKIVEEIFKPYRR